MNKKKEIAPKLRFPEFTDKWQNEKLGSIFISRQETGFSDLPLMSLTDECGLVPQQETNKTNVSDYSTIFLLSQNASFILKINPVWLLPNLKSKRTFTLFLNSQR